MAQIRGGRPGVGVVIVGLGTAIGSLDTAVNIAFPDIVNSFGIELGDIQWVVICYVLTYASLMLVCGRLGDLFGHARLFRIGLAWSVVAFVACAIAPAFELLLAARVAQGVGTALVIGVGPALATAYFPESARARVLGSYTLLFALGGAVGPSLGGVLVDVWGWAGVFWFRAPIALAALLLFRAPPASLEGKAAPRFDAMGAVLLTLAIGCLLLGINRTASGGWSGSVLLLVALAAGARFALRDHPSPIIRLAPFRRRSFFVPACSNIAVNLVGFAVMLLVPFWLDRVAGMDVLTAGALLALSPLGMALASPLAGRWAQRADGRRLAAAGALAVAGGLAGIGLWGEAPGAAFIAGALLLHGAGLGIFQVAYLEVASASLPRSDRGVAGSLVMMTRTLGVVLGATGLTLAFNAVGGPFLDAFAAVFLGSAVIPVAAALALALAVDRPTDCPPGSCSHPSRRS